MFSATKCKGFVMNPYFFSVIKAITVKNSKNQVG